MQSLTPKQIVGELDRFIIGQYAAKKAVAIALRNRWRRLHLDDNLRDEVLPKNILMIGPTGVGKTEIARRLAKLVQAPFVKVEATKFTEVGYVGRDVEQIIRDLIEVALMHTKQTSRTSVTKMAQDAVQKRLLTALVGDKASPETQASFSAKLESGTLEDREIEIEIKEPSINPMSTFDVPGMPGAQMGMVNIGDILGKALGQNKKLRKITIAKARKILMDEESDKLIDQEAIVHQAIKNVEQNGIVFIDEIDKICARQESRSGDISREGVQRDLLPLIEGTSVNTKYGVIKTDHILFITSGAFHLSKPSDLLPELQGRLPIRVEMNSLVKEDFARILTEPETNLIKQYQALIAIEKVNLVFDPDSINEIAALAAEINENVENIGARRLHTVLEKLLEDISYNASERVGEDIVITAELVKTTVGELAKRIDISKFVL